MRSSHSVKFWVLNSSRCYIKKICQSTLLIQRVKTATMVLKNAAITRCWKWHGQECIASSSWHQRLAWVNCKFRNQRAGMKTYPPTRCTCLLRCCWKNVKTTFTSPTILPKCNFTAFGFKVVLVKIIIKEDELQCILNWGYKKWTEALISGYIIKAQFFMRE